ncbi:alpha/beta hydrolase [Chondromyces crocatus]|nr:alpha/beta hydrolase-fold protein [Chondromyces crocatus]
MTRPFLHALSLLTAALTTFAAAACGGDEAGGSGGGTTTTTTSSTGPGPGSGGAGGQGAGGEGQGGSASPDCGPEEEGGGGEPTLTLDDVLASLRTDRDGTLHEISLTRGWPALLPDGYLFVSTSSNLTHVAGDHDGWVGAPLTADQGFSWALVPIASPGGGYKFTDLTAYEADPWARSYTVDSFGELSLIRPSIAHLDRYRDLGDADLKPRDLRVWVPQGSINRVLYAHDGQNLFFDGGPFGSWRLEQSVPPGVLVVGIDNTSDRMDEYTHVTDTIGGNTVGGQGDAYVRFLGRTVRPLIQARYGEPGPLGVMGSSLGGLISLHIADRCPGVYAFAASLSGTVGWGSIGDGNRNETMLERYTAHTRPVASRLYLDVGGGPGSGCVDADGDGIEDDTDSSPDNYCENEQLRRQLAAGGAYTEGANFDFAWHEGAIHNEAAWAARVGNPFSIFAGL